MVAPPFIFADLQGLISALIPVLVFVFWLIGQIAGRNKAPAKPVRPQQPVDQPPGRWQADEPELIEARPLQAGQGQAGPVPAGQPRGDQKNIFDEIEQFLARARQQMQQGRPAAPPEPERRVVPAPRPVAIEAEIVEEDLSRRHNVDEHVRRHLDTSASQRRIDALGDSVEVADDKMEAHMQEKFHHQLGRLASASHMPTAAAAAAGVQAAADRSEFLSLFHNSQDLRKAIVLNEILHRPADRW